MNLTKEQLIELVEKCDNLACILDAYVSAIETVFNKDFGECTESNDPWINALNFLLDKERQTDKFK